MHKKPWPQQARQPSWQKIIQHTVFILTAIIISLVFNVKAQTLSDFIIRTITFTVFIYLIMCALYHAVYSLFCKKMMDAYFSLAALFALVFFMLFTAFYVFDIGCDPGKTMPHFRTNTLTNKCEFSGYSKKCNTIDPWYYKKGCNLTNEKMFEFMNKTPEFNTWMKICSNYCYEADRMKFCKEEEQQLPCKYLIICNGLEC